MLTHFFPFNFSCFAFNQHHLSYRCIGGFYQLNHNSIPIRNPSVRHLAPAHSFIIPGKNNLLLTVLPPTWHLSLHCLNYSSSCVQPNTFTFIVFFYSFAIIYIYAASLHLFSLAHNTAHKDTYSMPNHKLQLLVDHFFVVYLIHSWDLSTTLVLFTNRFICRFSGTISHPSL